MLFPELAVTGYPPEDLLLKEHFLRDAREALERSPRGARGSSPLVGFPERADDVYNALAVLRRRRGARVYRKTELPNYGVFDEERYFQVGDGGAVLDLGERAHRPDDLRGPLGARPARLRRGARRRGADPQRLRVAVPRGQGPRSASGCSPSAPATT